jgi:hypothetical protein
MKRALSLLSLMVLFVLSASSQINFTANDFGHAPVNTEFFQYGANMGYYGPSWDDNTLADITAGNPQVNVPGAGVKSLHLTLPENFLELWAYNIRVNEFNHYASLGIKDNTVILEGPTDAHRDPTSFGCQLTSRMFRNMYQPIWDGGANGTPVNDSNYLALYIYKTVTTYKQYVKYWEIINEPDLEWGYLGDSDPGTPGNWWENNPDPCALPNLFAPVYQYVRALHIAYEVIKSVDPTAYVSPGGLGKPAFLDAILRNTDNPVDGSVTSAYPLKGGAYFDVVSIHMYPMYSLKQWNNNIWGFDYFRYSDAAIQRYLDVKNKFASTLTARGYNDVTYPAKHIITTENDIPNVSEPNNGVPMIGSQEAQRNYVIKALVQSQKNNVDQYYVFVLGNDKDTWDPTANELDFLGLYQNLVGKGPLTNGGVYGQQYNESGIAYKTTSDLLLGKRYDASMTTAMNLPTGVEGAAFKDNSGSYTYVLWAKTTTDLSEVASATYSFPTGLVSAQLTKKDWNFSTTGTSSTIASTNIALNGTPTFLTGSTNQPPPPGGCDAVNATAASGSINVTGITSPVATIQVFNGSWSSIYNQTFTNSPGTVNIPSLSDGTYHVKVSFYSASWSPVCNKTIDVTLQSNNPPPGNPDCNAITVTSIANGLKLKGLIAPIVGVQIFNNSWSSIYSQTFANSPDTLTVPPLSAGTYHVNVKFYTSAWGYICDKTLDATVSAQGPPPGNPDCSAVTFTPIANGISLNGMTAPVITLQVFNNSWTPVLNQTYTNSPGTVNINSLASGTYHVKVDFNTASWTSICERNQDVAVSSTGSAANNQSGTVAEQMTSVEAIAVSPNPFSSYINVTINWKKNEEASMVILDVTGREVYRKQVALQGGVNRFTINPSSILPGSYFMKLVTKQNVQTVKLLKQ